LSAGAADREFQETFVDSPAVDSTQGLPQLPNEPVATPCFVIFEDGVRHNLRRTAEAAGGIDRLMPHVKTYRAPRLPRLSISPGATLFRCAPAGEALILLAD